MHDSEDSSDEHEETKYKGFQSKKQPTLQPSNPLADPQMGTTVKRKSKAISNLTMGGGGSQSMSQPRKSSEDGETRSRRESTEF